jgi:hypothetical protein
MKRPWLVLTIFLVLSLIVGPLVPEDSPSPDGSSWSPAEASGAILAVPADVNPWYFSDEDYYTPLELPPGMILCYPADSTYRCLAVPDGTVILFPVPQSAPVDSL